MKKKIVYLTLWAFVGAAAAAIFMYAYVFNAGNNPENTEEASPVLEAPQPVANTPAPTPPPSAAAPAPAPAPAKWVPPGFKGPSGPPHIVGPSGPPPNY